MDFKKAVADALGSVRASGLEPPEWVVSMMNDVAEGLTTIDVAVQRVLDQYVRPSQTVERMHAPCVLCGHDEVHSGGGIGICLHAHCGCDGPTDGVPGDWDSQLDANVRAEKSEFVARHLAAGLRTIASLCETPKPSLSFEEIARIARQFLDEDDSDDD